MYCTATEPWVSVKTVASHLGVAKDSLYRWIEGRPMPAHRIGRLSNFKPSEVDAWMRPGGSTEILAEALDEGTAL